MRIKLILVAIILAVGCVVSGQMGWNYYPAPSFPYSVELADDIRKEDTSCFRELKANSRRLREATVDIGIIKGKLNALEKKSLRLAEQMVDNQVWTTKKFDETSQQSKEMSYRLEDTKAMILNLILYVKEMLANKGEDSNSIDIGRMPSSCTDLALIGHTHSGLYSVMGTKSIETVYCDFTKQMNDSDFQKFLGYVDVKSTPTFFHVQKNTSFSYVGVPIPFEIVNANSGKAMNVATGIFTAPQSGTYSFSFAGLAQFQSSSNSADLEIRLFLNDERIASSYATKAGSWSSTSNDKFNQVTLQSTLNLKAGDDVWLEIYSHGMGVSLHDAADWHHTHFTGLLVEEDLV
ncbi:C1q and tumor necrosis factor-related protein 3 [Daphnia sinensis]|uniref:C1q and tumor necrosis factor-related protein 3 n=1 Tax=Daphnia sinensis TaxID=1820382 RepID=A0AAD5Q1U1_9CRUS|nr:C1q and tumor necrosis factor-related protein 3 [Daphnia sinensis]